MTTVWARMDANKSIRKAAVRIIPIVAVGLLVGIMPASSQDFATGKISVCANQIRSRTDPCREVAPPFGNLDRVIFRNQRIDFKFTIFGQKQAFDYLQSQNYLPVRVAVWRDGFRKNDDIALDISQSDWDANGDKMAGEFSEDGQFRWRTFFHINLQAGNSFRIEINDGRAKTVESEGSPARLSLGFKN